ncbi:MAG: hypothetical protein ACO20H_03820 [Bacteriovoracaceae bacterium]
MINPRYFLNIMGLIPLTFIIIAFDQFVFNSNIKDFLAHDSLPGDLLPYFLFYPHILMGLFSVSNKKSLKELGSHLGTKKAAPLYLGLLSFPFGMEYFMVIFSIYGSYHLMKQQFGIESLLTKNKGPSQFISWISIGLLAIFYYFFSFPNSNLVNSLGGFAGIMEKRLYLILMPFLFLYAIDCYRRSSNSKSSDGKWYIWLNFSFILLTVFTFQLGYFFFSYGTPRMIHDLSSFRLYQLYGSKTYEFEYLPGPAILWVSVTPFLIVFTFMKINSAVLTMTIILLSFFHFFMESIIWQSRASHYEQVIGGGS